MAKRAIAVLSFSIALFIIAPQSSCSQSFKPISFRRAPRFPGGVSASSLHRIYDTQLSKQVPRYVYETRYFKQRLDHFSFAKLPKFNQRYLISMEHWSGPDRQGPIFMYCGNEGDIEWFAANTGFVWEIAPRFGAMVIFPEHRYYGKSMPFGSKEKAYKDATTLSYLTTEQALADYAELITSLKRNLSAEASPVVLFGGSYGGMLAAWMRLKYPHIAIGALASSAPILQFQDIAKPDSFYDIVSNDFKRESTSCFNTIKASWNALTAEGKKKDGLSRLTKMFGLCGELKDTEDLAGWLDSAFSYLAMVNYPYPSDFLMPLPGYPIREVCRKIDGCPDGTSILERVFEGVSVYYNYTGEVNCFDLYDDPHGMGGWDWQSCTEMVMPMSSNPRTSMFPRYDFNLSSNNEDCRAEFKVNPRPRWMTTEFGGKDIKNTLKKFASNIIFSNGLLDPWSGGSVTQNISDSIVALNTQEVRNIEEDLLHLGRIAIRTLCTEFCTPKSGIILKDSALHISKYNHLRKATGGFFYQPSPIDGGLPDDVEAAINSFLAILISGAHHVDLRAATAQDPDWLKQQRATEIKLIKKWLSDYYQAK